MTTSRWFAVITIALGSLLACATDQQILANQEPTALATALARGRFDLNCPDATGVVLSSDLIQPAIQGPWVSGIERLEYTIGVEGCGQRTTIVVMCQEGSSGCVAANPDARYPGR